MAGAGADDLSPSAERGLSLLCLDAREKCDLKGGYLETLELKCSTVSWLREASTQRVRPDRFGSQRGRLSFPPSRESKSLKREKPMICAQMLVGCGKVVRQPEAQSARPRVYLKSARLGSSKRLRHFQRTSHQSGD